MRTPVHPKVQAAGLAGALTVIAVVILTHYGWRIDANTASAITAVLAFVAGYMRPSAPS